MLTMWSNAAVMVTEEEIRRMVDGARLWSELTFKVADLVPARLEVPFTRTGDLWEMLCSMAPNEDRAGAIVVRGADGRITLAESMKIPIGLEPGEIPYDWPDEEVVDDYDDRVDLPYYD